MTSHRNANSPFGVGEQAGLGQWPVMTAVDSPGAGSAITRGELLAPVRSGRCKGVRLTERDFDALRIVGAARAIRLDDLSPLVRRSDGSPGLLGWRSIRDNLDRWRRVGAVALERNPWGGNGIVVSLPGIRVVPGLPDSLAFGLPPMALLGHTVECARIASMVLRSGWTWMWESELRADYSGHRPDGLMSGPGAPGLIAVEVELTLKGRKRWLAIARELVNDWGWCVYYADERICSRLVAWRDSDLRDIADRVQVKTLVRA